MDIATPAHENRHLRYLWRAYKRGELEGHLPLAQDLDVQAFPPAAIALMAPFPGELLMAINMRDEPVGMAVVTYSQTYDRRRAFPHVIWFKEATGRQRLEITLRFLLNLKKTNLVVIEAKQPYWPFFEHLCKYGVLRRVGTIRDAYGAGGRTAIYQGVGK